MGLVGWQALRELARNLHRMRQSTREMTSFQDRMAQGWQAFPGPILLLLSENDLTAQEFAEHAGRSSPWSSWSSKHQLTRLVLFGADHTCSSPEAVMAVEAQTRDWLRQS